MTFTVSRTGDTSQALTVNYATRSGEHLKAYKNAISGKDFTAESGILNFGAGDTASKSITVQTIQDSEYEAIRRGIHPEA